MTGLRWWGALLAVSLASAAAAQSVADTSVSFEQFRARHGASDRILLDRNGAPLAQWRHDKQVRRLAWVSLDDVSPALTEALLVAEDKRFYAHAGVDWLAVASAMWDSGVKHGVEAVGLSTSKRGSPRGASSLSMQVAALLDPALARVGGPRGVAQKWDQMQAAMKLEQQWSKTQILEAYLNTISFRGELQGLAAASWGLFDKAPSGLNKRESALLAALIRAPSAPVENVARRACQIWRQTSSEQGPCDASLLAVQVKAATLNPQPVASLAPHAARRLLAGDRALGENERSSLVLGVQRVAIQALRDQLQQLYRHGAQDGAVVVLDNATGEVLAYVGSSGEMSFANHVDAAAAPRQAGSTLKPFLYALGFDRGLFTPVTLLDDSPLSLGTDAGFYIPRNYNERYAGPVSVRKALASSLNVPAVRALMLVGVPQLHRKLIEVGITGLHTKSEHYGFSLALGSADVTLLDLTNAYRALANGGAYQPYRFTLVGAQASPKSAFQAGSAWLVGHILSDNAARESTFGFDSVLATPFWTAVKTGTSKDMRDNWCIGYSSRYTVGVWVGNASGAPMRNVSGVSGAAPAWADIMRSLHGSVSAWGALGAVSSAAPPPPPSVRSLSVRFENETEPARTEWFSASRLPSADDETSGEYLVRLSSPWSAVQIVNPQAGALIAWDPDIPSKQQAIMLRHNLPRASQQEPGKQGAVYWVHNGQRLQGERLALKAGVQRVSLHAHDGVRLDEVVFEVRGIRKRTDE